MREENREFSVFYLLFFLYNINSDAIVYILIDMELVNVGNSNKFRWASRSQVSLRHSFLDKLYFMYSHFRSKQFVTKYFCSGAGMPHIK